MKLKCSFDSLTGTLSGVSSVVEDAMSSEVMKNIIFRVHKDHKVDLIGINQVITYRINLPEGDYETEFDEAEFKDSEVYYMQVKSKELTAFLNTFKSVRRTRVTDVIIEPVGVKIKVTVLEEDLDGDGKHKSAWLFDNIPIKPNLLESISLKYPEDNIALVDTTSILFYTANLLPIMQNGSVALYSRLTFGGDKVVAFTASFNTLMTNVLPDTLKGISLTYRAIAFMKNVICNVPSVEVSRTDRHLCFRTDNAEAFIIYDTRMADYRMYLDMFKKDHAIVLDRKYFKDVLKRLSIVNDSVEFKISSSENIVSVKNSKFGQDIPILQTKGMDELGEVKFKILPDILDKAVIGDDSQFSDIIFLYLVPQQNGSSVLIFADDSGMWYSTASIR